MTNMENNYVLARSKEHKLILETLGELESVLHLSSRDELVTKLKSIIETFQKRILIHQQMEEKVIFQAALEVLHSEKIVALTLRLQKEHGQFTATIESLIFKIWNMDFNDNLLMRLSNELKDLTTAIKKHSLTEVKELFPILSNNLRCKQLIDKYAQNDATQQSQSD